jgi:hypothetical protein
MTYQSSNVIVDSEIQVPKCKVSATKETRNSEISDQISDNVMDDRIPLERMHIQHQGT